MVTATRCFEIITSARKYHGSSLAEVNYYYLFFEEEIFKTSYLYVERSIWGFHCAYLFAIYIKAKLEWLDIIIVARDVLGSNLASD